MRRTSLANPNRRPLNANKAEVQDRFRVDNCGFICLLVSNPDLDPESKWVGETIA